MDGSEAQVLEYEGQMHGSEEQMYEQREQMHGQEEPIHGPEDLRTLMMFLCMVMLMVVGIAWIKISTKREQRKVHKMMKKSMKKA